MPRVFADVLTKCVADAQIEESALRLPVSLDELFANGSLVRQGILERSEAIFAPWRAASQHILGLHVRGTDKAIAKKIPPEAYFPCAACPSLAHV